MSTGMKAHFIREQSPEYQMTIMVNLLNFQNWTCQTIHGQPTEPSQFDLETGESLDPTFKSTWPHVSNICNTEMLGPAVACISLAVTSAYKGIRCWQQTSML